MLGKLSGLAVLIAVAAHLWAIVQVQRSRESTRTKVLWMALVLLLPVLGLIIWLFAGPRGRRG